MSVTKRKVLSTVGLHRSQRTFQSLRLICGLYRRAINFSQPNDSLKLKRKSRHACAPFPGKQKESLISCFEKKGTLKGSRMHVVCGYMFFVAGCNYVQNDLRINVPQNRLIFCRLRGGGALMVFKDHSSEKAIFLLGSKIFSKPPPTFLCD